MASSGFHYPISLTASTEVHSKSNHTHYKTQPSCQKYFHLKEIDQSSLANRNKWVWEMAKEVCYVLLISSVSAYYFRSGPVSLLTLAKGNTSSPCIPQYLFGYPSALKLRCYSLLPCQVSFCWKSRGCWKPRRWQRKLHASTAGSLMWSSAQPTCSGECFIGIHLCFNIYLMTIIAKAHTQRQCVYSILWGWDGWAMVFQGWVERSLCMREGGLLSARFIQELTLLLS